MGITCQNKVARCSHAWIHTLRSSMLIIVIAFCQIEASNSSSWPNNKRYGEKDEREACQLNLYTIASHGNCKSQSRVWPLWRPYFHKPHFTVYTICLTNPFASGWSHEIMRWSINAFSHNSWNSPHNFIPWSMKTLIGTPNLLSTLSKNAYVVPSLLQSDNATNSNHLEKCSIITKKYQLCRGVKLNGLAKSKLH